LTNAQEFFAELSESYFGRNDFFPFDREELERHDPESARLVRGLWGVEALAGPSPSELRYELGNRLRALELEWDKETRVERRAATVSTLERAVSDFFGMRLANAARALDEARMGLRAGESISADRRFLESLFIRLDRRLIDSGATHLLGTIGALYGVSGASKAGLRLDLSVRRNSEGADGGLFAEATTLVRELPSRIRMELPGRLSSGEYLCVVVASLESGERIELTQRFSVVDGVWRRLDAIADRLSSGGDEKLDGRTARATAGGLSRQLQSLADGKALECDMAASSMIERAERLSEGASIRSICAEGDQWLTIVTDSGKRGAVRLYLPEFGETREGRPLVIAAHGAGGSENMFFETYGHGSIVDRCRERGWILAAPRSEALNGPSNPELVDALAEIYPIDRSKVFLIGHSMGAMQSVAAVSRDPGRFVAVAALGGGGAIRPSPELGLVRFYLGVGDHDFARGGVVRLRDQLIRAGVQTVTFREFADIEHLMIVQTALPEVFEFFDRSLKD
jgi:predicted esterase